ncbi:MAG: ABC transporter permease subunit [Defluviitaleaceae bacterium]|nr:ABC transporter permease subunit [Defluviitaleaceae bacterium]
MAKNSVAKKVKTNSFKKALSCWQLYILILPALIYVAIFNYGPMYGVQIAFRDFRPTLGIWGSEWVGLAHFRRFVTFPDFWPLLRNTLRITLYQLALYPLPIILAILFNEMRQQKFKRVVQMVTYAPYFLSVVILVSLVRLFFGTDGPINTMLEALGFSRVMFMQRADIFPHLFVWSGVWANLGWGSIIFMAALAGVSPELIEAATIDGASRIKVIWNVHLPAIMPAIVITFILNVGGILALGFERVFLMQTPLNFATSRVIATYVYEIGILGAQWSFSASIGLFNNIVNIIMLFIVNGLARRVSSIGLW